MLQFFYKGSGVAAIIGIIVCVIVLSKNLKFFPVPPPISHYTIDGKKLAPYPNMTDAELYEFEEDMFGEAKSFPEGYPTGSFHPLDGMFGIKDPRDKNS